MASTKQRLSRHLSRIGGECIYSEKGYLVRGTLTSLRLEGSVVEAEVAIVQNLYSREPMRTVTVACDLEYLQVSTYGLQAAGYVTWTLLTHPECVRRVLDAASGGLPPLEVIRLTRGLARNGRAPKTWPQTAL